MPTIRLLALELSVGGDETYHVSFSPTPDAPTRPGRMRHTEGSSWEIVQHDSNEVTDAVLGSPDEVFMRALGDRDPPSANVSHAAPHWPSALTQRLAQRRMSGAGAIAFDAEWFLEELVRSPMDRPLLFPDATSKLGLDSRACDIVRAVPCNPGALANVLLQALQHSNDWDGEGRWVGEFMSGELAQLGTDIGDGCAACIGTGPLEVVFEPDEPLGLSLGPLVPSHATDDGASIGMGVDVGEVEPGGAAHRAGVKVGMFLSSLSEPELVLWPNETTTFEAALEAIDARRAAGHPLTVTFATAAPVSNLYAVEMPAAATLTALAGGTSHVDVDIVATLGARCGGAVLWHEHTPRLFFGEPGSLTCAHTDICPQLELAQGLVGSKLLGVASHAATPRLAEDHAENEDEEATRVPTDRALTPRQLRLLTDADVTMLLLQAGDIAVFDSGALHFASNGADDNNAALYQGMITPAAVPRLRTAAAQAQEPDGAYRNHLHAADLLRLVLADSKARG